MRKDRIIKIAIHYTTTLMKIIPFTHQTSIWIDSGRLSLNSVMDIYVCGLRNLVPVQLSYLLVYQLELAWIWNEWIACIHVHMHVCRHVFLCVLMYIFQSSSQFGFICTGVSISIYFCVDPDVTASYSIPMAYDWVWCVNSIKRSPAQNEGHLFSQAVQCFNRSQMWTNLAGSSSSNKAVWFGSDRILQEVVKECYFCEKSQCQTQVSHIFLVVHFIYKMQKTNWARILCRHENNFETVTIYKVI